METDHPKESNYHPGLTHEGQPSMIFNTIKSSLSDCQDDYGPEIFGPEPQQKYTLQGLVSVKLVLDLIPSFPQCAGLEGQIVEYLGSMRPESSSQGVDPDAAILIVEQAASLIPDVEFQAKADLLGLLAVLSENRFRLSGDCLDLDRGFWGYEQMLSLYPAGHFAVPFGLNQLGDLYQLRYEKLGDPADFNKRIECLSEAVRLTPHGHFVKPSWLHELGGVYQIRFNHLRTRADIDSAIECFELALSCTSEPNDYVCMNNLGGALMSRFQLADHLEDIELAIIWLLRAESLVPEGASQVAGILRNLGTSYQCRFERLINPPDVELAIKYFNRAVMLLPDEHIYKAEWLQNLGRSHASRFKYQGNLEDLNNAISYQAEAVSLTPSERHDLADHLSELGTSYQVRFNHLGELIDLERAIEYKSRAVSITLEGHPDLSLRLNKLGASYLSRFELLGNIIDIDNSISILIKAASLRHDSGRSSVFNNLGSCYMKRFERLGEKEDINNAVIHHAQSVSLTPDEHPDKPARLSNLGNSYQVRYDRLGTFEDLEMAIEACYQAVLQTSDGHIDQALRLSGLGLAFDKRFQYLGHQVDIDRAINCLVQAVSLTHDTHVAKPRYLYNLGILHSRRLKSSEDVDDLEKAIACHTQSIYLRPEGEFIPNLRLNLGVSLAKRFEYFGSAADLDTAIEHLKAIAQLPTGYLRERYGAALQWGSLATRHQVSSPLEAYSHAMTLIPKIVWTGSSPLRRYVDVISLGGIATQAAAVAIQSKSYTLALEWLEQGRSIVWSQLFSLRAPLDLLVSLHPQLGNEFQKVSLELDQAISLHSAQPVSDLPEGLVEQSSQRHRRSAERWEEMLVQIRSLPGFETFLQPKNAKELTAVAQIGDVVVVNVHPSRSDALILRHGSREIMHIPLNELLHGKATEAHNRLTRSLKGQGLTQRGVKVHCGKEENVFKEILSMLWTFVVRPVVESLEYTNQKTNSLPRITWCTTGPLSFLPLHAAGDYMGSGVSLFDLAISSYTPNLTSLLVPAAPSNFSGILVVSQASNPTMPPLLGVVDELAQIKTHAVGLKLRQLDGAEANADTVLSGMREFGWVHFACHGSQDSYDPTRSAFHLHDGALTLGAITQKSLPNARFAFLAACQTAAGDDRLSEEAVHLAAGMIMVGYRTVIATMWSIQDEDAPLVTGGVYAQLLQDTTDDGRAANALHAAVGLLRDKVGVDAFARWVPYIHIGL